MKPIIDSERMWIESVCVLIRVDVYQYHLNANSMETAHASSCFPALAKDRYMDM